MDTETTHQSWLSEWLLEDTADDFTCTVGHHIIPAEEEACSREAVVRLILENVDPARCNCKPVVLWCQPHREFKLGEAQEFAAHMARMGMHPWVGFSCPECNEANTHVVVRMEPVR